MLYFACFSLFRSYIARYVPLKNKKNTLKKFYKNFKDINLNNFLYNKAKLFYFYNIRALVKVFFIISGTLLSHGAMQNVSKGDILYHNATFFIKYLDLRYLFLSFAPDKSKFNLKPIAYRIYLLQNQNNQIMENLKQMTDDALVTLYLEGNNSAFDILLNRHQDRLFNYIYFVVRSKEVAEDLFQETFVKAIVTLQQGRYTNDGKFAAWITRIAHNLVIDQFRTERNENTVSNDETEIDLFNDARFSEGNIENRMVNDQVLKDVRMLIDELPDCQREVVYMRYYQDLSFKEIADITGVSINTALGRMRYAVLNLRRIATEKNVSLAME